MPDRTTRPGTGATTHLLTFTYSWDNLPAAPKPQQPAPGGLPQAVTFVRQVGGLEKAKELLNQIDEIKKL
jgi:hypothetical protein